jgi:hypothetical protein
MLNTYCIEIAKAESDSSEILESNSHMQPTVSIVNALREVLRAEKIQELVIRDLIKIEGRVQWKNGQKIGPDEFQAVIKDCLAGKCTCRLSAENFFAHAEEDHTLYIGTQLSLDTIHPIVNPLGLTVSPFTYSFLSRESDYEFKTHHPILYKFVVLLGLLALFVPMFGYLVIASMFVSQSNYWMLLGLAGSFVFGVGLFNFVAIIMKQYLGLKLSIVTLSIGLALMAISILLQM